MLPETATVIKARGCLSLHANKPTVPYEEYETLLEEYERLLCRLQKILTISDKYQIDLKETTGKLNAALAQLNELRSIILPICMYCKRIRTDDNYWQQVESYFRQHIDVMFSHGICPECLMVHYGKTLQNDKPDESAAHAPSAAKS